MEGREERGNEVEGSERGSEVRGSEVRGRERRSEVGGKERDKVKWERGREGGTKKRGLRAHIHNITCSSCCVWTVRHAVRETKST